MEKKVIGSFIVGIGVGFMNKWYQMENTYDPKIVDNFDT